MNIKHGILSLALLVTSCVTGDGPTIVGDSDLDVARPHADAAQGTASAADDAGPPPPAIMEVRFSPNGGCTDMIVKRINEARKTVRLQGYTFTSKPIIAALVASKASGVDVQVVLDRSAAGTPGLKQLQTNNVPVKLDKSHVIAHNKVVVVDDRYVLTGSFNFTYAAEHQNAENCLLVENKGLAGRYAANWEAHNAHSVSP